MTAEAQQLDWKYSEDHIVVSGVELVSEEVPNRAGCSGCYLVFTCNVEGVCSDLCTPAYRQDGLNVIFVLKHEQLRKPVYDFVPLLQAWAQHAN